ncbi:MAG: carbamoyl-phosphate synthase large subunit [Deltaproteobacteria bacterium]|nr:carbamoyl-phosphate synthase large subunit [Deltaproteobacteria bacterium]
MPKRIDIKKILVIGSGPIQIGQACEFDYSGTQALKALMQEGYQTVLVNSNPATIMTDPEFATATYIEPLTVECLTQIIEKEKPDALLPTVGGQTALNLAMELDRAGVLKKFNVELIGAKVEAIHRAEDRKAFKECMQSIGLKVPESGFAHTMEEARAVAKQIGFPLVIRPAFTLGGMGGSIAHHAHEFEDMAKWGLSLSPVKQILIEKSVEGWKEFELEVMRDCKDNVVIICSIENLDPMGVHTGDSITVAPAQTLTDREYQQMRDSAILAIRAIGVDTGGCNIQFAVNPKNGEQMMIEINPRVSRSSALASKATGFPIAKIAAKLAVGYTLDELPNDITKKTPASFEPSIDYVVTKIPRFSFEKFPRTPNILTTQMKSVGEVMAIGRTFKESLAKAVRSLEIGGRDLAEKSADKDLPPVTAKELSIPRADRLWLIAQGFREGLSVEEVHTATNIDPWFLHPIRDLALGEKLPDTKPVYKMVDTCAAEFEAHTPYLYSTRGETEDECPASSNPNKVMILGSGPNRIGQGIEFDYACVHASMAFREAGFETIMVNCNPETVSTDYDISDRLYFEPLTFEDVMHIVEKEKPSGVVTQFGGQTPLKLALALHKAGVTLLGTSAENIDRAEDRKKFKALLDHLELKQPPSTLASSPEEAIVLAKEIGFPLLLRPSYVLGGRAMVIVHEEKDLPSFLKDAFEASGGHPVLIDHFLKGATEVDVDAIGDGDEIKIAGVMEHIEEAGVHSGDSSCCLPPHTLSASLIAEIERETKMLGKELGVKGLMNIQFAVQGETVYVLEVNPRASRTVPFVSKATGIPWAKMAARVLAGKKLKDLLKEPKKPQFFAVKSPVFPFIKFPGVDTLLSPEMCSIGEVMGRGLTFAGAFAKAQIAAGQAFPKAPARIFLSVHDKDKADIVALARSLKALGYALVTTKGTHALLKDNGVASSPINKLKEGSPHIVEALENNEIHLVINTTLLKPQIADSYQLRRTALEKGIPYCTNIRVAKAAVEAMTYIQEGGNLDPIPL